MLRQNLCGEVDAKPGDLVMDFCAGSGGKVPLARQTSRYHAPATIGRPGAVYWPQDAQPRPGLLEWIDNPRLFSNSRLF
jgi:hypothetical protein